MYKESSQQLYVTYIREKVLELFSFHLKGHPLNLLY